MIDPADVTVLENWCGGFYELAVELGPTDDDRLERAIGVLARTTGVGADLITQDRIPLDSVDVFGHLRGTVVLPEGLRVVAGICRVREQSGSDWALFYLPLGALSLGDARVDAYPFVDDEAEALAWRRPIDDWFADLGRTLHDSVGMALGLIGFEVSGNRHAADLTGDPDEPRGIGFLVPGPAGLRYLPAQK